MVPIGAKAFRSQRASDGRSGEWPRGVGHRSNACHGTIWEPKKPGLGFSMARSVGRKWFMPGAGLMPEDSFSKQCNEIPEMRLQPRLWLRWTNCLPSMQKLAAKRRQLRRGIFGVRRGPSLSWMRSVARSTRRCPLHYLQHTQQGSPVRAYALEETHPLLGVSRIRAKY